MKNFVQHGEYIEVTAPNDIESGELVAIGDLVGIAVTNASKSSKVSLGIGKIYAVPKEEKDELKLGQKVAVKNSKAVPIADGLPYAGIVTKDAGQGKSLVEVLLK